MMHIKCLAPCLLCKKQLRSAVLSSFPIKQVPEYNVKA